MKKRADQALKPRAISSAFCFVVYSLATFSVSCGQEKGASMDAPPSSQKKEAPAILAPLIAERPSKEEAHAFLESLPIATDAIGYITDPYAAAMGVKPTVGMIFNLYLTKVTQKVPGGYFLYWAPPGHSEEGDPIFLRTELDVREDVLFTTNDYWAVFTGPYQYQNIKGFRRSIHGFDLLTPKPTSQPRDFSAVDMKVIYDLMSRRSGAPLGPPKLDREMGPPKLDRERDYTPPEVYDFLVAASRSQNKAVTLEPKHGRAIALLSSADLISRGFSAWRAEEICADLSRGSFALLSQTIGIELRVAQ